MRHDMKVKRVATIVMAVCMLGASALVFAATPSLDARKELNAIGVRYDDAAEFFKAAKQRNWELVRLFLDAKGVTVESASGGKTLLDQAINDSDLELMRFLLKNSATPNPVQLERIIRHGKLALSEELFQAPGFNKAQIDARVIVAAIDSKDITLVLRLLAILGTDSGRVLNAQAKIDGYYVTRILNYAIETSSVDMLKLLIEHGADVNAVDGRMSMSSGSFMLIISSPPRLYKTPETPLMRAAAKHNDQAVRMLLDAGVEINKVVVQEGEHLGLLGRENALSYADKYDEGKSSRGKKEATIRMLVAAGAKMPDALK